MHAFVRSRHAGADTNHCHGLDTASQCQLGTPTDFQYTYSDGAPHVCVCVCVDTVVRASVCLNTV